MKRIQTPWCRALAAAVLLAAGCSPPDSELTDRQLYVKYCARCHGVEGRGVEGYREEHENTDLSTSEMVRSGGRRQIHRRIAYGKGDMPAFVHRLAPPELDRLTRFVLEQWSVPGTDAEPRAIERR